MSEVLRAAAKDTFEVVNLQTERSNNMLIYVIIVLVSFAVFLFVIAILVSSFLSTMATAGAAAAAAGAHGFMGKIDLFAVQAAVLPRRHAPGVLLGPRCRPDGRGALHRGAEVFGHHADGGMDHVPVLHMRTEKESGISFLKKVTSIYC